MRFFFLPFSLALLGVVAVACSTVTRDKSAVLAEAHGYHALMNDGADAMSDLAVSSCCVGGILNTADRACLRAAEWIAVVYSRADWHRDATLAGAGLGEDPGKIPDVKDWRCPTR